MVYRIDNRPKKHRGRYTILGIVLGIALTVGGIYVYDNYKQPILDTANQIKNTAVTEVSKPNTVTQNTSPQSVQDNSQSVQSDNQPVQTQQNTPVTQQQTPIDPITLEHKIHEQINNARVQAGLRPLNYDEKVATVARDHSKDMAINNYFDHTSPDGKTVQNRFYDARLPCYPVENIEQTSPSDTADSIVQVWMNSSGHRANILDQTLMSEGIGVYSNSDYTYITEDFC